MWDQPTYHKNWRNKNRDKLKANQIKYRYGLTTDEYQDLLLKSTLCSICGSSFTSDKDRHIDHDHENKHVRGVLCTKCNVGLGMFRDNKEILHSAISYLLENSMQDNQRVS